MAQSIMRKQRSLLSTLTMLACIAVAIVCFMPLASKAADDNDYGTVIGIDLGTTYSAVAYVSLA
jgi:hypothetical protein